MKLIRVFPRRTKATPDDADVRVGYPGMFDEADQIHISVTFKWDIEKAKGLERAWGVVAPVRVGGPALGDRCDIFEPGMYLRRGYVITSRGCPNHCWFCDVPKREGGIRELPITEGNNVLDNNLLACSDNHIRGVFAMLRGQKNIQFTGGLEAARLKDWHIEELVGLKPKQMFFAYDTESDYEPLISAGRRLLSAGFNRTSHVLRCFVLFGFAGDTPDNAQKRFHKTMKAGFMPMAMYYRPDGFSPMTKEWHDLQWLYSRPAAMRKEYVAGGEKMNNYKSPYAKPPRKTCGFCGRTGTRSQFIATKVTVNGKHYDCCLVCWNKHRIQDKALIPISEKEPIW